MFGKKMVVDMINRSAQNEHDRRNFLRAAGLAGLGVVGSSALLSSGALTASAAPADAPTDPMILNFALNLEYLEAEFYLNAYYGWGLPTTQIDGVGTTGGVTGGGRKVKFKTKAIGLYAKEIAQDELTHVEFLRSALGGAAVARPKIDLKASFTAAARAAGLITSKQTFDPFANENNFLLAAFLFEDVGVTAYKGAAPLIDSKVYLEAAAGILAVEAYHAGIVRSALYGKGLRSEVQKLSNARDSLDGSGDDDQGIGKKSSANIVPTDHNGLAFSRTTGRVLNIVYLNPGSVTKGGFFPNGVHGDINQSGANG